MTKQIDSSNLSTLLTGIKNYVDNKFATKAKVAEYLPKSGGELTGVITATNTNGAAPFVIDTTDNGENADKAWISANNSNGAFFETEEDGTIGSRLVLRYPSHATQSGHFQLRAMNSTASSTLIGTPEGSLTWKGNELAVDSNVVHLTGTEDITGKKTIASNLNIKNANLTRGTNPASNSWIYMSLSGSGGDATNQRFGTVASGVYTTGSVRTYLEAYKNTASTTTNAQLSVTYPASGDPYASAPTTPTGSTGTEIITADYLNSTNSGVVHTTGNETIAGTKSFTGVINIAEGAGITFTNNGVTQRLISTTPNLQSVEGNNAVSLRLGYGGSTYVTGGECAGYITTDNGFAYSNENVQLMADSNVYIRTGLNNGWNADLGAVATNAAFRPIADGGMTLGTASYRWGNAYIGTTYMNGSIVFDETATISGTSTRHLANISMNNSSLNFGAYDQTHSKWIWWATPAGVNTFNGNAVTATKATQDADGNVISSTYAKDADVVHLAGEETITGVKTFNAQMKMQYSTVTKGTIPTANRYMSYLWTDNAGTSMGGVQHYVTKTTGNTMTRIYTYKNDADSTSFASVAVNYPTSGDPYGSAPSTPAGSTGTEIVTADFLKDWVKTTVPTGAKFTDTVTTATTSGSGNVVTAVTASNGALTVTKGSTAVLTSGNQTIAGTKTFSDPPIIDRSDVTTTAGTLIGAYTFKASTPSGTAVNLIPFQYIPSDQTANIGIAIGSQSGATVIGAGEGGKKIYATNNAVANSESLYLAADGNIVAYCGCANDGSGATNVFTTSETSSTFYVPLYAPTAASGTDNTQVATTAFVNSAIASDSSVVHTTGDQTVGGKKTFTSVPLVTGASPCYQLKNTGVTKGTAPSANNNKYIMQLFDSNGTGYLSALYKTISTGNVTSTRLYDYGNSASGTTNLGAYIAVCHDGSGNAYTYAPTPAAGDNSTKIATTAWVTTELGDYATQSWVEGKGYLTAHQSITGKINVSGSRGELAGYQTSLTQATALTVTYSTNDISTVTGAVKITVSNSTSSIAWTKVVDITNASATIALGNKWKWVGGTTPTVSANCTLVLHWNRTFGVASLLKTTT